MTTHPSARMAMHEDIESWINLAREVEPLFGPMPDITTYIERAIARGTALVAEDADHRLLGAALLSGDGQPHHIHWLAVRADARRRGVGNALLASILERWNDGNPIHVVTFGADNPAGIPARQMYATHGFTFVTTTENGPEGGSREEWIRR